MAHRKTIFVIGGTGAQGFPVIETLAASDSDYAVKILTRDVTSDRAKRLASLPNVELVTGTFASEVDLRAGFSGSWGAFVNIDGFNCGEKAEIYWGIRSYEIALECGVKFFVWGNLDFVLKESGYNSAFRTGHYDGKGRVGEWILTQNEAAQTSQMSAALFTTGPYIQMSIAKGTPMAPTIIDGVLTWKVPLGIGAVVHVDLDDCGHYVKWLFDNNKKASGMNLKVGIAHVDYHSLAKAFTKVTGKPARYQDISLEEYWAEPSRATGAQQPAGHNSDPSDPATMTRQQNFTGFWNMWKASGGNKGLIRRDYALLDEIHPGRVKSAEEWFRRENERGRSQGLGGLWDQLESGNAPHVLKSIEDGRRGRL
ncbi:uncharacterized protein KY384_006865 [Bacidia gigantensis]|uniref:uncharacterized protein n=1 Tax=Bacidia gigantensis TaxID=2732470 RepID=UPI001D056521|nr:uncharacterized protein KY384_006865 [Bacidia gigantensis]KAG8527949.1 hypothetical protein KY384_006865 [Bacidia gigantensis]